MLWSQPRHPGVAAARFDSPAAALAKACDENKACVGFLAYKGGGGVLLQPGYAGNSYTGYTTYTRIPPGQEQQRAPH